MSIKKKLNEMAAFYLDSRITGNHIEMYASFFKGFGEEEVIEACNLYMADSKNTFFPIPPQKVMNWLCHQVDDVTIANDAASRIPYAIRKFGYWNGMAAHEYIGSEGWEIVQRYGGWATLCESHGVELDHGTFHAQARDLISARLKLHRAGYAEKLPGLPPPSRSSQLTHFSKLFSAKKKLS